MSEGPRTPSRAFILGLADTGGGLDAEPLYAAAEAAGFTTTTIRLAVRRLLEAGLVESEGRGRKATLQLTAAGLAERLPDLFWVAAAHRSDAGLDGWDALWHLVSFEIPERQRAARDALRNRIVELQGAPLGGALYVSPHPWEPWIAAVASEHEVTDHVTTIEATQLVHHGSADIATVARSLWPLDALAADYESFVHRWRDLPADVGRDAAVRIAFQISSQIEYLLRRDPLLPPKMLSPAFAGPVARARYIDVMDTLAAEPLVAEANIYRSYRATIDRALRQSADEFWTDAYANTGANHR